MAQSMYQLLSTAIKSGAIIQYENVVLSYDDRKYKVMIGLMQTNYKGADLMAALIALDAACFEEHDPADFGDNDWRDGHSMDFG